MRESVKLKPCQGAINSRSRNLRTALEKYFRFHGNCKQLRIEARNSMFNCEIYHFSLSHFSRKLYMKF